MNEDLREWVQLWIAKARADWRAVQILSDSEGCPNDVVCYHCQQYVEKLLKALLTASRMEIPRTHDLRRLADMAGSKAPEIQGELDLADQLTVYGVQSRYPDQSMSISEQERDLAVHAAGMLGGVVEARLNQLLEQGV